MARKSTYNSMAQVPRGPDATREAIMRAAEALIATSGPASLTVRDIADLANVSRSTIYQHFEGQQELAEISAERIGNRLIEVVFPSSEEEDEEIAFDDVHAAEVQERLSNFVMENPDQCRMWLFHLLSEEDPRQNVFGSRWVAAVKKFFETGAGRPGVDPEIYAVMMLALYIIWPIWISAKQLTKSEQRGAIDKLSKAMAQIALFGAVRPEHVPLSSALARDEE